MKKAPIGKNEVTRLRELESYEILDTSPELSFDDITALAAEICKTPIALVSIVDSDRQWFKSRYGLDATETPRDVSFCGHAIHTEDIFEITNATKDERFSDNPLVTGGPNVVFYAGYRLRTKGGQNLGTLCVIDHESRELTDTQREALKILARQVMDQLELRRTNISLRRAIEQIDEQNDALETQRMQAFENARLASLGIMAGGIAHEINNPLSIISLASADLKGKLRKEKLDNESVRLACERIDLTVTRINKIIKGLLSVARDSKIDESATVTVAKVIEDAFNVCGEKFAKSGVKASVEGDIQAIVDRRGGQIAQTLINLLSNAYDATLGVETRTIRVVVQDQLDQIVLSVIDSGPGVPRENCKKIMDPFFTTKPVGKGTGLGLSVSKSIIEQHGGDLLLDRSSKETKFDILLPKNCEKEAA